MQVSIFGEMIEVKITLKITPKELFFMAYSTYQEWIFEKVCYLREVDRINKSINQALKNPKLADKAEAAGTELYPGTPPRGDCMDEAGC